ncbi:MAG: sugar nucleotide-binding protein [Planctomycetaceae bacterium]|nr:sugar nucleotide-binding protein [Planctomycetaceae bacterium]
MSSLPAVVFSPSISEVPLPLLITGVAGVPGYNAMAYFAAKYPGQVIGIRQADNYRLVGPGIVACNAEDRSGLARLFEEHRFASVLDCAGNCALRQCELAPELAWRINVEGVRNLLSQTVPRGIRLVHLSCDLVYSGEGGCGGYVETDPADPVTVYGKTMVAGEQSILAADPTACILRISLPMGVSFSGHAGAIDWIASRFKKSRPATLYFDEVRTPTYVDCLNRLYERALGDGLGGIYHAGASRRLALYQIAQIINRVGGYDPDCLMGIPRREASPIPPRAGNVCMDSSKLVRALGYDPFTPWPYCETLVPTHVDWHRERPAGEERSPKHLHRVLCRNPMLRGVVNGS